MDVKLVGDNMVVEATAYQSALRLDSDDRRNAVSGAAVL